MLSPPFREVVLSEQRQATWLPSISIGWVTVAGQRRIHTGFAIALEGTSALKYSIVERDYITETGQQQISFCSVFSASNSA
jgi:hypothetical protein